MLHSDILQEGGSYDDYIDEVLAALITIDNTEFKLEIILMKSKRVKREPVEVREIICVATTKYHDLFANNECAVSKDSDVKPEHLNFMAANPSPVPGNNPKTGSGNKIEDWRKKKTQDKILKNGLVWYWCHYHK